MIFTERTITVVNDSATINKPLILYRGDKNIELKITIAESQFKFRNTDASNVIETTDASYAQLVINTPYNSPIFSDVAATKNGAVIFVITEAMIDEIREVGAYEIQIRLLDDNKQSRASIPPVSNAIEIREPIAIEDGSAVDSNAVNVAKVNRALTTTSAPLEAFDSQGNYIKKTWGDGDPITDAALNKMEAGIDGVNKKIGNVNSQIKDIGNLKSFYNIKVIGQNISDKKYTNIKLLGDSITDGYGGTNYNGSQSYSPSTNTEGYCWANNFKDFLHDRYNINVVNKGMYGTTADRIYNNISNVVSNTDDLVIYLTGTNDRPSSDLTLYKNSVKNIITYVKNIGADIIVMSGIPATESNENQYAYTMQDMDDVVKIICSDTNTPFISMYQEYVNYCETHSIDITTTFYDHCHPNDLGYYIMFVLLCKKLYLPLNPYKNYKYKPTDKTVTNISIDSTKTIKLNDITSLTASITPSDATNKEVTWSVNNDNVTLTPNGLTCGVQGVKVGTSTVTVTSKDTTNGTIKSNCIIIISENAVDDYTLLCGNLDYTGEGDGPILNTTSQIVPMVVKRDFDTSNYTTICSNKTIRKIFIRIHTAGKLTIGKADLTQYNKNTDITVIDPVEYDVTTGLNVLDVNVSCGTNESLTIGAVGDTALPYFAFGGMTDEQFNGFSINTNDEFKSAKNLTVPLTLLGAIYI